MVDQYLEYSEYLSMGGKLEETKFNSAEREIKNIIDVESFNRLINETPVRKFLRYLVFDAIQRFSNYITGDGREIASESAGRASVSYYTSVSMQTKIRQFIRNRLQSEKDSRGIPLLYSGNV